MVTLHRRNFLQIGAAALVGSALPSGRSRAEQQSAPPEPAAKSGTQPPYKMAGIQMVRVDGKYNVWTKKVGSGAVKVLTLHGGPGFTHEYLECFEDFLPQAGIQYYYYDQLGSHYSDQPDDDSLWTVDRFREEVEQVRRALGLENFYLYGHSWGGMLGIEYALKYQRHLKGLVIADMTASIPSYMEYAAKLRSALPANVIATLDKYEKQGKYDAPEYEETMMKEVYARHVCRLDPWPEPAQRAFRHFNTKVYNVMQGPNEFVITGNFKDWDRWKDLPSIRVPTYLPVGRHSEMDPNQIRKMGQAIPVSRVFVCENGSHLSMWDDQETYFRGLLAYFRDVEAGRFKKA